MKIFLAILVVLATVSDGFAFTLSGFFWPHPIPQPEVIEVIRWRQSVCLKPGKDVQPCSVGLQKLQKDYERVNGRSLDVGNKFRVDQTVDGSEDNNNNNYGLKVVSASIISSISIENLEASEIEIDQGNKQFVLGTPNLEGAEERTNREAKYISISTAPRTVALKPPPIYVTKVIDTPVTAVLVAENCLPDIGVPLCQGYDASVSNDKTKPSSSTQSSGDPSTVQSTDEISSQSATTMESSVEDENEPEENEKSTESAIEQSTEEFTAETTEETETITTDSQTASTTSQSSQEEITESTGEEETTVESNTTEKNIKEEQTFEKPEETSENPETTTETSAETADEEEKTQIDEKKSSSRPKENSATIKQTVTEDQKPGNFWENPESPYFDDGQETTTQGSHKPILETVQSILHKPHEFFHHKPTTKPQNNHGASEKPSIHHHHHPIDSPQIIDSFISGLSVINSVLPEIHKKPVSSQNEQTNSKPDKHTIVETIHSIMSNHQLPQKPTKPEIIEGVHNFMNKPTSTAGPVVPEVKPIIVIEATQKPHIFQNLWSHPGLGIFDKHKTTTVKPEILKKNEENERKPIFEEVPEKITFEELLHKPENELLNRPGLLDLFHGTKENKEHETIAKPTEKPGLFGDLFANPTMPLDRHRRDLTAKFLDFGHVLPQPTNKPLLIHRPNEKPLLVENPIYVVEKPAEFGFFDIFKKPDEKPIVSDEHDIISEPVYIYQKPHQKPGIFGGFFQGWNIFNKGHQDHKNPENGKTMKIDEQIGFSKNQQPVFIVYQPESKVHDEKSHRRI